jgi:hypothetical protein
VVGQATGIREGEEEEFVYFNPGEERISIPIDQYVET